MNRRRIGLAALVVGAGAAVRRRLKTQVDAGPDLTMESPDDSAFGEADSGGAASGGEETAAAPTSVVADSEATNATPGSELPAQRAGDPTDNVALSSSDLLAEASANATSSADLLAESATLAPSIASASLGDPQLSSSDVDADPVIRLPTMPPAGSRVSEIPSIVVPTAAGAASPPRPDQPETDSGELAVPPTNLPSPASDPAPQPEPQSADPDDASTPPTASNFASVPSTETAAQPEATAPQRAPGSAAGHVPPAISAAEAQPDADPGLPKRTSFYREHRAWSIAGSILLGLIVVAVVAASLVRLPYYSLQPGSVYDTIGRVDAPGDLVSIPRGEIGFVTVAQTANITPWQWLDAKLDNNVRIRHEDEVRGDQSADELREADIRRMQVSKNSAVVVALRKLGFDLVITPIGIEVAQVFDCTAADGTLGTGDLIVGVNGVDVRSGEELVEQLMGQTVGADVDLLIERIDPNNPTQSIGTELVAITLGSADAACLPEDVRAEEPRPFIGIGTLPMFDEDFPIDIDVRTGAVSGPSAGLAFTLAIMDVLSEGELTNELSVVATGTIDRDGNVGPVGGIHQKTIAAERSGADVFIVPRCCDNFVSRDTGLPLEIPSNYEEALLYAEDMIVIGVDTIDEALIALGELGGDVDAFVDPTTP